MQSICNRCEIASLSLRNLFYDSSLSRISHLFFSQLILSTHLTSPSARRQRIIVLKQPIALGSLVWGEFPEDSEIHLAGVVVYERKDTGDGPTFDVDYENGEDEQRVELRVSVIVI
jgi:hypothetical protein